MIARMLTRGALLLLAACSFTPGVLPGAGDGGSTGPDAPGIDMAGNACAASQVAANGNHTCARTQTGDVYCWGSGGNGEVGVADIAYDCRNNTSYCARTPRRVDGVTSVSLGLGVFHTCSSDGMQTHCWGENGSGELGDGTLTQATTPRLVTSRAFASSVGGGGYHTCTLHGNGGGVRCSGLNLDGQVGNAAMATWLTPVEVTSGGAQLGMGKATSCAITVGKTLTCWGRNVARTIETSSQAPVTVPQTIDASVSNVVAVAVGYDHICAIVQGGSTFCWGDNGNGQLGNGTTSDSSTPVVVANVGVAVGIAANENHTCVLDQTGGVWCFGEGYTEVPTKILEGASSITAGTSHDCAAMADGTVRCWGDQTDGQLGNDVSAFSREMTPQQPVLCN